MAAIEVKKYEQSAVKAIGLFRDLLDGSLGVTVDEVRREFAGVAVYDHAHQITLLDKFPETVARCVLLGLNPATGERLENPDKYMVDYNRSDMYTNFADRARTEYEALKETFASRGIPLSSQ